MQTGLNPDLIRFEELWMYVCNTYHTVTYLMIYRSMLRFTRKGENNLMNYPILNHMTNVIHFDFLLWCKYIFSNQIMWPLLIHNKSTDLLMDEEITILELEIKLFFL